MGREKEWKRWATKQQQKRNSMHTHTVWMRSPVCTSVISIHLSAHDHYNCFFSLSLCSFTLLYRLLVGWLAGCIFLSWREHIQLTIARRACVCAHKCLCTFAFIQQQKGGERSEAEWTEIGLRIHSVGKTRTGSEMERNEKKRGQTLSPVFQCINIR